MGTRSYTISTPRLDGDPFAIGTVREGRYQIDSALNNESGGMGNLFLVTDLRLKRRAVMKTIKPHLLVAKDSDDILARFEREATLAAMLASQYILGVDDYFSDDNVHYFVMPWIPGATSLFDVASKQGLMPLDEILAYGLQGAAALRKAHSHEVVHRDVKLDNFLVYKDTEGFHLKLIDFGVAYCPESTVTRTGAVLGTPSYFAPESVAVTMGAKSPVDPRSDLFAFGVVLYRLLTGRKPFTGDNDEAVMRAVAEFHPPRPSTHRAGLVVGWDHVVMKALQKAPEKRYQTADELLEDLKRVDSITVPAPESGSVRVFPDPKPADDFLPDISEHSSAKSQKRNTPPVGEAQAYMDALASKAPPKAQGLPKGTKIGIGLAAVVVCALLGGFVVAAVAGRHAIKREPIVRKEMIEQKPEDVTATDILRDEANARRTQVLKRAEPEAPPQKEPVNAPMQRHVVVPKRQQTVNIASAAPVPPPVAAPQPRRKDLSKVIQFYEPDPADSAPAARAKNLGIPSGQRLEVTLVDTVNLSSDNREAPVAAELLEPLMYPDTGEILPKGTQFLGRAAPDMDGDQTRITIMFSTMVFPDRQQREISAIATMSDGSVGLLARATKKDERAAANLGEGALDIIDGVLSGSPGGSIGRRFSNDGRRDARDMRKNYVSMSVGKGTSFVLRIMRPV